MARLKKTLPSTPKSREQLLHEQQASGTEYEPGTVESQSSKIRRGAEPLPSGAIVAKDMAFDISYLNFEGTRRVMKLVSLRKDDVEVTFYSGSHYEWVRCTVAHNYPVTSDLTGIAPGQIPKSKETKMAKQNRKHGGAAKAAKAPKEARAINPATGYKEGTVGDRVGKVLLEFKSEDKRLEAAAAVVKELFQAKGKGVAADVIIPRAKHIIAVLRKEHANLFPTPEGAAKSESKSKKAPAPKVKKVPVEA